MTLLEDVTQNGSISLSFFGSIYALGFRGTSDFVERGFNLCHNRGIIGEFARMRYPFGVKSFGYVTVRHKERITRGIASQLRSEMVMSGEVKPKVDSWDEEAGTFTLEFDEAALDRLALVRAEQFVAEHIPHDHFMSRMAHDVLSIAPIYEAKGFGPGNRDSTGDWQG